jgi:hypothetical protein
MAVFPKIQSPCPYKNQRSAMMEGDFCRMCRRNVVDLSAMDEGPRLAFLAGCEEEVCVSYRLPLRSAVAAAALAALGAASPALAQEAPAPGVETIAAPEAEAGLEEAAFEEVEIFMGGIKDPSRVELIDTADEAGLTDLPVSYEDPAEAEAGADAKPVSSRPGS